VEQLVEWEIASCGNFPLVLGCQLDGCFLEDRSMDWKDTGKETEPDRKRRVSLGTAVKTQPGVRYKVLQNDIGQILLDPVKSVPAYEAWIYENPARLASIQRGVAQAEAGELIRIDLGTEDEDE
jgi:hypothetical protein